MILDLIEKLESKGVFLALNGENIDVQFEGERLSDTIVSDLKINKKSIVQFLKSGDRYAYKLSPQQLNLWFECQFDGANQAYNQYCALKLSGPLDFEILKETCLYLVKKHEVFRTCFKYSDTYQEIRQYVSLEDEMEFNLEFQRDVESRHIDEQIIKYIETPFDLEKSPLFRCSSFEVNKNEYIIVFVLHHLICDGWSLQVLLSSFQKVYESKLNNEVISADPLKIQYKDFCSWQINKILENNRDKEYWLKELGGQLPKTYLSNHSSDSTSKSYNGAHYYSKFSPELKSRIAEFIKEHEGTLFMFLFAGIQSLLYRYNNQKDTILATPVANREHPDLKEQVGFYVNVLPIRIQIQEGISFLELFVKVKQKILGAFDHKDFPISALFDDLQIKRDIGDFSLYDFMIVLDEQTETVTTKMGSSDVEVLKYETSTSKLDLTFHFKEVENGGLELDLEYNTDVFDSETIEAFSQHLQSFLSEALKQKEVSIENINYISTQEKQQLLVDFNESEADYPKNKTLVDLFVEQAKKTPHSVAVVFEEKEFTYEELDTLSNQLGNYLRETYKIIPDDLIGIQLERSEWMIISILGVLKSGGAYVPIDPEYPEDRIKYIVEDSECKLVIDVEELGKFKSNLSDFPVYIPAIDTVSTDLAYVIYTSGSTGKPKGCMLEHQGIVNRIDWMWNEYGFTSQDTVLQKTTFTFDVSVWEIFMPLCWGCKMILASKIDVHSPRRLLNLITNHNITTLHFVPSFLSIFVESINQSNKKELSKLDSLKQIITSGEILSSNLADQWVSLTSIPIYNLYGPTEASIEVTHYKVKYEEKVLIGRPINNTQIYILSSSLELVPIGIVGEICIGGDGLSRGYLNNSVLTAAKFINHPFKKGKRIYRTGDLGKWLPDGNIEFIGRRDNQIKIRGRRVELGEIENVLRSSEKVSECVVIVRGEGIEDKSIIAYIIGKDEVNISDMRNFLKKRLPIYMIPNYFMELKALPLTSNGKIDRKNLPEVKKLTLDFGVKFVPPRDKLEKQLAEIWSEVLGINIEEISIHEDFFALGGHSLKVIQVINKIKNELGVPIQINHFFNAPTIEEITEVVRFLKRQQEVGFEEDFEDIII